MSRHINWKGWTELSNPPNWVKKAASNWYHSQRNRPYDRIKHFKGRHNIYRVYFERAGQGQTRWRYFRKPKYKIHASRRRKRVSPQSVVPVIAIAFLCLLAICIFAFGIPEFDKFSSSIEGVSDIENPFENSESISSKTMDIEKAILKYTNDERVKNGMSPLSWDENLAAVAREHSQDMAENDFFSHINLKGEDPTDRAVKNGYPIRKSIGGSSYRLGIAENIGKMPTGNVIGVGFVSNNPEGIAKAQVNQWMYSIGHRRNILDSSSSNLGVGVAKDGIYYISTQNFW